MDAEEKVKDQLGKALYKLMEEKPLRKITEEEIVKAAGVSQKEFTTYFHSRRDLAHWVYVHILALHGKDIMHSHCWSEATYKKFQLYAKHLKFLQNLYTSCDVERVRETNRRFVRDAYHYLLRTQGGDLKNPHVHFAVEMFVVGGEEMTMRWILDGMNVPIEVMLVLFQEAVPKNITHYFY